MIGAMSTALWGFMWQWRRTALCVCAIVCALAFSLWIAVMGIRATQSGIITLLDMAGVRMRIVSIEAPQAAPDIIETLDRHGVREGVPITSANLKAALAELSENPMIAQAAILRTGFDRVRVQITPRVLIAQIKTDIAGRSIFVARDGTVVHVHGTDVPAQDQTAGMMMIDGVGALEHLSDLWPLIGAEPEVMARLQSARYVGQRRWDLILRGGTLVQLPENAAAESIARLGRMLRSPTINLSDIRAIDMRAPDRLFIRPAQRREG